MRLENSIKNIKYSILSQFIVFIVSFISRTVFINILGSEYLGLNGLLSNIITVISLADLGIGTVLVYSMYEPLANNDIDKLSGLMVFYKKVYHIIAIVVFLCGLGILPFLNVFIKDSINVGNIHIIFFLFLINTVVSYLCVYKISILNADQKGYIVVVYQQIFNVISTVIMITGLIITHNYYVYLIIQIIFSISSNLYISQKAEKIYPFIKGKSTYKLNDNEMKKLKKNVFAIFFHRIGGVVVSGTDNILISSLVSITDVGIYSNYTMLINTVKKIVVQFFGSITAAVGNLIVETDKEYTYSVFNKIYFANFWIYGFCSIAFLSLFNLFINLWIGENYLFNYSTVLVIVLNFYIDGMRQSIQIFKDGAGLFWNDRYKPLAEALVNLVVSIILGYYYGVIGILIGTFISMFFIGASCEIYVLFKNAFSKSIIIYYKKYFLYFIELIFTYVINISLINVFYTNTLISFFISMIITAIVPNIILLIFNFRTSEFQYYLSLIKNYFRK